METDNIKSEQAPPPIGSHKTAFNRVLKRLEGTSKLRVLDAPSGHGALAYLLMKHGHEVVAGEIDPKRFRIADVECHYCNLNEELPFEPNSFDVAVICNGLHRAYNIGQTIANFSSVLKQDGRLIITTQNFGRISRRLKYFFCGITSKELIRQSGVKQNAEKSFRHALLLPQIEAALSSSNLKITYIEGFEKKAANFLGIPFWPIIRLGFYFISHKNKKSLYLDNTVSFSSLFSNFLLIESRKKQ